MQLLHLSLNSSTLMQRTYLSRARHFSSIYIVCATMMTSGENLWPMLWHQISIRNLEKTGDKITMNSQGIHKSLPFEFSGNLKLTTQWNPPKRHRVLQKKNSVELKISSFSSSQKTPSHMIQKTYIVYTGTTLQA